VERLKLPKPKETKWFTNIDLWETPVNRSLTSGVNTLEENECGEVDTPEARRVEEDLSRPS
jgi:hypothetical protein